jgi:hypothetical protein
VTLSNIVEIYLHLCRNSGVEQPEPLYLTLRTRANLSAEVAALLSAAKEGKGISDIQPWEEEYEHPEHEETGVSNDAGLSEQVIDKDEHEQTELETKEPPIEGQVNEWTDGQYEHEPGDEEETGAEHGEVEDHEHGVANQANVEPTEVDQQLEDGKVHVAGDDVLEPASPKENLEVHYDFDETNSTGPLTQNQIAQPEGQPEEGLSTNVTQDETEAADEDVTGGEDENYPSNEQEFETKSHNGQEAHEEFVADEYETEDKDLKAALTDASEVATADDVDYVEIHPHQDDKENADEEDFADNDHEEGEYNEDEHQGYEDYADEENHEEAFDVGDDTGEQFTVENEETEEPSMPEHGRTEGSYATDQLDQESSDTVSVSHEPVDKSDHQAGDLQTDTNADVSEVPHEDTEQIPDLPELSDDDDLISLGEDFFGNPEEVDRENTEGDNGLDVFHIEENNDSSVDQVASADDNTRSGQLTRQESSAGKRPRDDEEEDFGLDGTPSPDTKRTRSS